MLKKSVTPSLEEAIALLRERIEGVTLNAADAEKIAKLDLHDIVTEESKMLFNAQYSHKSFLQEFPEEKLLPNLSFFNLLDALSGIYSKEGTYSVYVPSYDETEFSYVEFDKMLEEKGLRFCAFPNSFFENRNDKYQIYRKQLLESGAFLIIKIPSEMFNKKELDFSLVLIDWSFRKEWNLKIIDARKKGNQSGAVNINEINLDGDIEVAKSSLSASWGFFYNDDFVGDLESLNKIAGYTILDEEKEKEIEIAKTSVRQIVYSDLSTNVLDSLFRNEYFPKEKFSYDNVNIHDFKEYTGNLFIEGWGDEGYRCLFLETETPVYIHSKLYVSVIKDTDEIAPLYIAFLTRLYYRSGMMLENEYFVFEKDTQERVIDELRSLYEKEYAKEIQAERERKSLKTASSDLAHILAPSFSKITSAIANLKDSSLLQEDDRESVMFVEDNVDYMRRMIGLIGRDSLGNPRLSSFALKDFVQEYVGKYERFGANTFAVRTSLSIKDETTVKADRDFLYILFDSIFDNANRHGFGKRWNAKNFVEVSTKPVVYKDSRYINLCISNNGKPMELTEEEYISRGKFGVTGRTGLGGHHVFEAVKRMNGFLHVQQDGDWLRFNCLLPIEEGSDGLTFEKFDYECL